MPDSEQLNDFKVSCLMVTRGDRHRVRQSIKSFLNQTIISKELVIVTDVNPLEMLLIKSEFSELSIQWIFVKSEDKFTLGQLRNLSVESARGQYIAQWDDDDLYDPSRLQHQIDLIEKTKSNACILSRWTVWWPKKNRLFISGKRTWEGSIVCIRSKMPRYPSLSKGEDTPLINELLSSNKVAFLDAPRLYIYVIHGSNTWNEQHFEKIYLNSTINFTSDSYYKIFNELSRRVNIIDYFEKFKSSSI
jgi:glycosyltransferase involved in cell wall biosynthesis